jgi:hypothetical protein
MGPVSGAWEDAEFCQRAELYLTGKFGPKYFEEATDESLRAIIEQIKTKLSSEINSLCDKNTETIVELTDDCSHHLREDEMTQFREHLNTLSATTKAEVQMLARGIGHGQDGSR